MDSRPPTNSQPSNQLLCLAPFRLQGLGDLRDLGIREVYMQVVVLITDWVGPIEGVRVCALVLDRPLLRLVVTLQGLPSRVSCAQGAEVGEASHRSSHRVFGCCRPPIGLGLLGPIARDGVSSGAGATIQVGEEQPNIKGSPPRDWQQSEGGSGSTLGSPPWPALDDRLRC
jgi:hypothetical protein